MDFSSVYAAFKVSLVSDNDKMKGSLKKKTSTLGYWRKIIKGLCPVSSTLTPSSSLSSITKHRVDVQLIVTESKEQDVDKLEYQKPAYVAVGLILAITSFVVVFPVIVTSSLLGMTESMHDVSGEQESKDYICKEQCRFTLAESIPENLTYPEGSPSHPSTYDTWKLLIDLAEESIDIASFYWTLKADDISPSDPSDWQGEDIFKSLKEATKSRHLKLRIAQNQPTDYQPNKDTEELKREGLADVRSLNFTRWFGAGILHTKLWIVDKRHFYVGSANMDWRSLTQVKELGTAVYNCSCLTEDMSKLFSVYWEMGEPGAVIPEHWNKTLTTRYNKDHPIRVELNLTQSQVFISSSPPEFCPMGRTSDIDAIIDVIEKAKQYIYIAVMDYFPATIYSEQTVFWPVIDDALRRAALDRKVEVRLLASKWNHTRPDMTHYLTSLAALSGAAGARIYVKYFTVPSFTEAQREIPFARVNHNKYMVTDNAAYIGTSNWSADYFISTGGIGLIVNQTASSHSNNSSSNDLNTTDVLQQQLTGVFLRDWDSVYTKPVIVSPRAGRLLTRHRATR